MLFFKTQAKKGRGREMTILRIGHPNFGFTMEEVMSGVHSFAPGQGPVGEFPMEFKVKWGTDDLIQWLNPRHDDFMFNALCGTVTIGGLCEKVPCFGTLELRYFKDRSIRYTFWFRVADVDYFYTGEKRNIWPWNLMVSHTTCYGKLVKSGTCKTASTSVTHFRLKAVLPFLLSFRPLRIR